MNKLIISFCMILLFTGCSGGGGTNSPIPKEQIQGLAAEGRPLSNEIITLKDSLGVTRQTQTDDTGKFVLDSAGLTFPALISGSNYLTIAYSSTYVNLTPFTTMAVSKLVNQSPNTILNNFPSSSIDLKTLSDLRVVSNQIKNELANINLDLTNVNILEDQFQPVAGNLYDDLLESLKDHFVSNNLDINDYIGELLDNQPVNPNCTSSQHLEGNVCVENTISCQTQTGSGTKTWVNNQWSACVLSSCNTAGFIVVGGVCVQEPSPDPDTGGTDVYQSVVLEETNYEDVSPFQPYMQETEDFSFIARESTMAYPTSSGYLVDNSGLLTPFKITTPALAPTYIYLSKYSLHKKDNNFFFFFGKVYKSIGVESQATEIGGQSLGMTLDYSTTVRSGEKVYGFFRDSGMPATLRYYNLDTTTPSLMQITSVPSGLDANNSKILGKDGQGNIIIFSQYYNQGALAGYNYYSINPTTNDITLIDTQSYSNFRTVNGGFIINGTELSYLQVGGKFASMVSIKIGSSFKQHIQFIGNGTVSRTLLEDSLPIHSNVFKNNLYIKSAFYDASVSKIGIRKINPVNADISTMWSKQASGFDGAGFTTYEINSILGLTSSDNKLYAIFKRSATTSGVTSSTYKLLSVDGTVSELNLPASASQLFDNTGEGVNFNKLNYIKGGIAMVTSGGDDRNKLYRMRVDNGEMELIKGDFYYNSYDDKSINHIWTSKSANQVFITGESANTNGTYSKLFILK